MALFAIQLVRVMVGFIPVTVSQAPFFIAAEDIVIAINQMLNVIILIFVHFYFCLADSIYLNRASHRR